MADFARFLLAQQGGQRWEELAYPQARPKLDAFLRESAEGEEPLVLDRHTQRIR